MRRLAFYFLGFFVFVSCLFCFSPKVYAAGDKQQSSTFGYKIPPFPSDVGDYNYIRIVYDDSYPRYSMILSKGGGRPYVAPYNSLPYAFHFPSGSTLVCYQWYPLSETGWTLAWGPNFYSSGFCSYFQGSSEDSFRAAHIYLNANIYDSNNKLFFVKTPLMNFTIMQSSISGFLQRIFPPLITITTPSCLVLLGVSVISLVLLPKLFKVFLKT